MSIQSERVIRFRHRRKLWAIESFGGRCGICGYDKCRQALHFHHLDPSQKDFQPSGCVLNREQFTNELRKCVMLCGNCHSEVHAGITKIPSNIKRFDESFVNKPIPEKPKHKCPQCGKFTPDDKKFCSVKCSSLSKEVANWPTTENLKILVEQNGYSKVGRMFGVSDNAVRKRLIRRV